MKNNYFLYLFSCLTTLLTQVISQEIYKFPISLNKDDISEFQDFSKKYTNNNMQVFHCDGSSLYLRGGQSQKVQIEFKYEKPYYQVDVSMKFFRIDSWDKNEDYFYIEVNNILLFKQTYSFFRRINNNCANQYYDEEFFTISKSVKTNQYPIKVTFYSNLDSDLSDESWGFREFQVQISLCPSTCSQCTSFNECTSCIPGYYLERKMCNKCSDRCQECAYGSEQCTKCKKQTYLFQASCKEECPPGYYKNQNEQRCDQCRQYCKNCSAKDTCDLCQDNYFRSEVLTCVKQCNSQFYGDPVTKKCQLECSDSYFANKKTNLCEKCDPNCLTCSEISTNCTSCPLNTYLINQNSSNNNLFLKCVPQCPEQQFYLDNDKKKCLPCYKGCKICSGPSFDQCTECNKDFLLDKNKCIRQDCGDYYYANPDNNECARCQLNCIKCKDFNSCEKCVTEQEQGKCKSICDKNEFQNGNECIKCNKLCEECYGQNEDQCLKCQPEKQLKDGKCFCKQGYYLNGDKSCIQCDKTCKSCFKDEQGKVQCEQCIANLMQPSKDQQDLCQCKEGFILENHECKCKEGQFLYNNSCLNCHFSCKECKGPGIDECISCKDQNQEINKDTKNCTCKKGYYFNNNDNSCQKCYQTCQNCLSSGESDCYSCLDNSNLILVNPTANTSACQCQPGFYFDTYQLKCQKCYDQCKQCRGETKSDCLSCNDDFMLLQKVSGQNFGTCECQDSFFYDEKEKKCKSCHISCNTCSGSSEQECLTCSDPNSELFKQQCNCKQGFFQDKFKCVKCHIDCQICDGPENTDCLSCSSEKNKILIPYQNKGICACKEGYYQYNEQGCIKCYQNCKKCSGSEQKDCLDCSEGPDFIKDKSGKCVCIDGFYESVGSNKNRICLKCNELCSKCDGQGKCLSCKSQVMKLNSDNSTCECIDNYTLYKNKCMQCPNFCKKCVFQKEQPLCIECNDPRTMEISPDKLSCVCKQQFYEYVDTCKACSLSCKTCKGGDEQDCIQCSDQNMIKDSQTGICKCQGDLVFDQSTRRCVLSPELKCKDQKCLKCNQNQCFQCISNYQPKGDSCICKDGFYDVEGNQGCQYCQQQNCLVCKTKDSCEICEEGLIRYKGMCYCPDSKYKDDNGKCSLSCDKKCKLCLSLLECHLTKEESDKYDYEYCDISCDKCSGPLYYNCWNCSSQTRYYDENLRTCICKKGYVEIYEKDCKEINSIYIELAQIFSLSSGSLTFFFMVLSLLTDSIFSKTSVYGYSCLFAYSYVQFQQLGNFLLVNKVYPLGLEQNFLQKFLQLNYFNSIPSSFTPISQSQLNRVLQQSLANDSIQESLKNNFNSILFNNPKYNIYKLDTPFIILSFYPMVLSITAFIVIFILYFLQARSNMLQKIYLKIKWNLSIIFIYLFSNSCLLSAITNLKYFHDYSSDNLVNIIATSVFCLLYFGGFIYLFYKINFQSISYNNEDFMSYLCLHFQICQENMLAKNFWLLIELRKMVQIILLVSEQNFLASLISIAFFSLLISLIFMIKKPFINKSLNVFLIVHEIILIIIYMGFSLFATFSRIELYSVYVIIIAVCIYQFFNFFQIMFYLLKTFLHCFHLRSKYVENLQAQQGLIKTFKEASKELSVKNSLELHNIHKDNSQSELNINLSLDQITQKQIKWNNNPLLSPSKVSNNRKNTKTVNLTKRSTHQTSSSQIQNINFKQF
ncbi:zinc finger lsd1 subclass family protein (macronuclear) [Tetrahymena thermophila SB210]|uniref:Zinc finger lsd1 subclass family protein n=1 Tax=Tetrahymena thermophila (strain SB210) TaxID=312017 RepID=I7M909_TETTS|nr:zinc finger lsd1 subclass family protein [Tetrahymena thermophila SB210]EAS00421.2 zinc finger lsd1 subclass family protein [Tetrahymena thermophila SB210]|eukprot:XP_001020666.2 zinc finger lsd1 subclass family protein [Tetrahymena thermophila SB210]